MTRLGRTARSASRTAARWPFAAGILALALAGCGPAATASPVVPTSSPAASPSAEPSATASGAPTTTPATTPTPTATATTAPTPTVAPTATPVAFACTRLPYVRHSGSLSVRITAVRLGQHPGYDRIVYEFGAGKLPAIDIRVVEPPFKLDPSDLPVTIAGSSFIQIKLTNVAVEMVPASADDLKPGYPLLTELRQTSGFEGDATWIAGFSGPVCVRVSLLTAPSRLVIDARSAP